MAKSKPSKRTVRNRVAQGAQTAANMTAAQRRALTRRILIDLDDWAPTAEAAESDLLLLLQAVASEFIRRYYPTATNASLGFSRYERGNSGSDWHAHIPVGVPRRKRRGTRG